MSMGKWRLLDRDGHGLEVWIAYERKGDKLVRHVREIYNADAALQLAKDSRELHEGKPAGDLALLGHIPRGIMARAMREGWWSDQKAVKRWMNDPDNRKFRVYDGTV